jgi:3-hydroxyisobutyrate dehydrogenase-like beta-hydroxyacid dehydrogenase
MESIRRLRGITAVCATLVLLLLPAVTLAELAEWDQERVTQIAEEFAGSMKALRKEMQSAPPITDPARQRALYVALDDIRIMTNSATLLANKLKAGEGRQETFAQWRRLDMLRRDFEENARKADIEDAIMDKILTAGELLIRLTPYYKSEEEPTG